jgi:hypothetical protein
MNTFLLLEAKTDKIVLQLKVTTTPGNRAQSQTLKKYLKEKKHSLIQKGWNSHNENK